MLNLCPHHLGFFDLDLCPEILAWVHEISGQIQIWRQNRKLDFYRENDLQSIQKELYDKMTAEPSLKSISNQFLIDRITKLYLV